MTILTITTRLFDEFTFNFNRLANRFTISHLRSTYVGFHAKFTLHAINQNFQMQLTHTRNNGLICFFIGTHTERRIFLRQTIQRNAHFFLVGFGFRLNRNVNHWLREYHALQRNHLQSDRTTYHP